MSLWNPPHKVVLRINTSVSRPLSWWVLHGRGCIFIRIGLLPHLLSGDCLVVLMCTLITCAWPMSDDTGLYQYVVSFVTNLCMHPWGAILLDHMYIHLHGILYPMMDYPLYVNDGLLTLHVCWCSMGFGMILLLLATVLGSRYFNYWYDNTGWCGL